MASKNIIFILSLTNKKSVFSTVVVRYIYTYMHIGIGQLVYRVSEKVLVRDKNKIRIKNI